MATQLWIQKGLVQTQSLFPDSVVTAKEASQVLFQILEEHEPSNEALDEVVEGANNCGDGLSIVDILQTRLKFALRGGQEFANVANYLLYALGRLTSRTHALHQEFLKKGTVLIVVNCLTDLAAKASFNEYSDPKSFVADNVALCFQYVCLTFYTTPGVQWVLQAVHCGLLEAFVACGPMYPFFRQIGEIASFPSFQRHFFLPVVSASADALSRAQARSAQETLARSSEGARAAWLTLLVTISKRLHIAKDGALRGQIHHRHLACDNVRLNFIKSTLVLIDRSSFKTFISATIWTRKQPSRSALVVERCITVRRPAKSSPGKSGAIGISANC